jgi:hypothetical protein
MAEVDCRIESTILLDGQHLNYQWHELFTVELAKTAKVMVDFVGDHKSHHSLEYQVALPCLYQLYGELHKALRESPAGIGEAEHDFHCAFTDGHDLFLSQTVFQVMDHVLQQQIQLLHQTDRLLFQSEAISIFSKG